MEQIIIVTPPPPRLPLSYTGASCMCSTTEQDPSIYSFQSVPGGRPISWVHLPAEWSSSLLLVRVRSWELQLLQRMCIPACLCLAWRSFSSAAAWGPKALCGWQLASGKAVSQSQGICGSNTAFCPLWLHCLYFWCYRFSFLWKLSNTFQSLFVCLSVFLS